MKQATMNGYFYVLTAIDLFVLSFMCILTKLSESLNKKQKQGFFLAFALIAAISVLEVVTLAVDGTPAGYRWLNILSNYLGFGLSPGVCLCLVYVMDRKKRMNRWFRAAVCCEACYLLFLALSIPAGLVFSVSADNVYSRGQYFYIYIILYFAAIVYLSVSTFVTAREFQNRSRALIYPLMIFLLIETIIQVTLPDLHVTWLCVTLLSVLYFIYCSEMWNQLDALTGLLNQNSYLNRTAEMRRNGGVLVVFDVDDFKQINDRYGHLQGDLCLAEIGHCIKKAYARSGYCYRTGGDEFCVLMENADREAVRTGVCAPAGTAAKGRGFSAHGVLWFSSLFGGGCAGCEEPGRPGDVPLQKGPEARCRSLFSESYPPMKRDCCTGVSPCAAVPFLVLAGHDAEWRDLNWLFCISCTIIKNCEVYTRYHWERRITP